MGAYSTPDTSLCTLSSFVDWTRNSFHTIDKCRYILLLQPIDTLRTFRCVDTEEYGAACFISPDLLCFSGLQPMLLSEGVLLCASYCL